MVLDAASSRIDESDAALKRFDDLGAQRTKLQADLKTVEGQEEAILDNLSLTYDEGAQQLAQCRALLDVVERRLESLTVKTAESQKAVFNVGAQAMEAAFTVWVRLRENREERAKAGSPSILRYHHIGRFRFVRCGRMQPWSKRSSHCSMIFNCSRVIQSKLRLIGYAPCADDLILSGGLSKSNPGSILSRSPKRRRYPLSAGLRDARSVDGRMAQPAAPVLWPDRISQVGIAEGIERFWG